jgi:hypothetical protein
MDPSFGSEEWCTSTMTLMASSSAAGLLQLAPSLPKIVGDRSRTAYMDLWLEPKLRCRLQYASIWHNALHLNKTHYVLF